MIGEKFCKFVDAEDAVPIEICLLKICVGKHALKLAHVDAPAAISIDRTKQVDQCLAVVVDEAPST